MAELRSCATCGQVMVVAELEQVATCEACKPAPVKGTAVRLFDAPQTTPGQMALE